MPRVKIEYVVSFSSEDPENQASNLLALEVSKKKWLCNKGEPSCSVVLQLTKAVKISAVHVGAHHAAFVEVLVGRSEKPNVPFEVLVPSSVFLSPADSRREQNVERVRSFSTEQLAQPARDQRWDRVRLVCLQPHNKHCKYGLSFVHIYEPEPPSSAAPVPCPSHSVQSAPSPAVPTRLLNVVTYSSDEDDFRPGELFAKHLKKTDNQGKTDSTDAQIRQATSQALKNISESSTKLMKTPISKPTGKHDRIANEEVGTNRGRYNLLYEQDDERPCARIDQVVQRHKDEKSREESAKGNKKSEDNKKDGGKLDPIVTKQKKDDENKHTTTANRSRDSTMNKVKAEQTAQSIKMDRGESFSGQKRGDQESRKRPHSDNKKHGKDGVKLKAGPISSSPHTLLRGVVLTMSGYENPRRSHLRTAALAMGARCERDWGPQCTHLICAFPNTPKLNKVRSSPNGSTVPIVLGEWIEQCAARRRLLPWQWYATEDSKRVAPGDDGSDAAEKAESECDTDDEIEKVLRKQKKQRADTSPTGKHRLDKSPSQPKEDSTKVMNASRDSDVAFVRDERMQGNITIDSDSDGTDVEDKSDDRVEMDDSKALPDFFEGYTFMIDEEVTRAHFDKELLSRYIRAYGGVVLEACQVDEESEADYIVCARATNANASAGRAQGVRVRADWVWQCHERKRLCAVEQYALS